LDCEFNKTLFTLLTQECVAPVLCIFILIYNGKPIKLQNMSENMTIRLNPEHVVAHEVLHAESDVDFMEECTIGIFSEYERHRGIVSAISGTTASKTVEIQGTGRMLQAMRNRLAKVEGTYGA
jgi:hypothetical protein